MNPPHLFKVCGVPRTDVRHPCAEHAVRCALNTPRGASPAWRHCPAASMRRTEPLRQLNVRTRLPISRFQPSAIIKSKILNGREIVVGGSIIMPIDIKTDATTMSITMNGM